MMRRCRSAIHFLFNFNEIKRERLRESQREKEQNTLREGRKEHRAPKQRQSDLRFPISDLRSAIRGDRASDDDDDERVAVMTTAT